MKSACLFDESLEKLVGILVQKLGTDIVGNGVVLRDVSGQLAFFSKEAIDDKKIADVSELLIQTMGAYTRPDRVVADCNATGTAYILEDATKRRIYVNDTQISYIDRRLVGADWLLSPKQLSTNPIRLVFASLKGGVGRSTALSVVAAEQARLARNILVIDYDLEAPGVGSMLLGEDRTPKLGVLDYFVESNRGPVDRTFVDEMVGTSTLTDGAGQVDVVPVVGTLSDKYPENFMAKLSRGMMEGLLPDGTSISVTAKLVNLLAALESRRSYDLILLDARAGMAELTAGPMLAAGANILLFGTSQSQTLQGLKFLFAHLSSLVGQDVESPWRALKLIHSKATHQHAREQFKDSIWELFLNYIYEEVRDVDDGFSYDVNDPDAPHFPIAVPLDTAFSDWDPVKEPSRLLESYYSRTFGDLLQYVEDLLKDTSP